MGTSHAEDIIKAAQSISERIRTAGPIPRGVHISEDILFGINEAEKKIYLKKPKRALFDCLREVPGFQKIRVQQRIKDPLIGTYFTRLFKEILTCPTQRNATLEDTLSRVADLQRQDFLKKRLCVIHLCLFAMAKVIDDLPGESTCILRRETALISDPYFL